MERMSISPSSSSHQSHVKRQNELSGADAFTSASFFALAEHAPDIICRFDRKFYHLYTNPAIEKVTGIPTTTFIGRSLHEVGLPPEFANFWNQKIQLVLDSQKPIMFEFEFPSPDGTKYFQSSVVPEFDSEGNVETVLSISRDITQLRESEKEKDAFIAMVTHELKTPVTSVKAFAQLLGKRFSKTGNRENVSYLGKMDMQLNRLSKLIGDMLDATRIGAGKMQFNERLFSFTALLKEIVGVMQKTTSTHSLILRNTVAVKVYADRDRIGQVLTNLLSNAIKYSPDSLPIIISTYKKGDIIVCCVEDRGPGIPKEKQPKLFQRFTRLTDKNHSDSPGLGLGLYISSEIIKQEGGRIWVESTKGEGATFCFTLPLKKE